jgi:putative ABC transport system permease protein
MTWHLMKLIWNRKRTNLLVMVEIFVSFLVVFGVVTLATYYADNYRQPLGYQYGNIWNVEIDTNVRRQPRASSEGSSAAAERQEENARRQAQRDTLAQLVRAISGFPEVVEVGGVDTTPFSFSSSQSAYRRKGVEIRYGYNEASDEFASLVGLEVTRGRWFGREDDGVMNWSPVIINEEFARTVFGSSNPLGENIGPDRMDQGGAPPIYKVVGVVREFKEDGDFQASEPYVIGRKPLHGQTAAPRQHTEAGLAPLVAGLPRNLLVKVRSGTTAAFEEPLMKRLEGVARDWSFEIESLTEMRETSMRFRMALPIVGAIISFFLLLMVAMGLTGVLWQNVTQRTKELGLRRAKGATAQRIHNQILGEVTVLTSFAVVLGVVLVLQFPLLDFIGPLKPRVYAAGLVISLLAIYVLAWGAAWYPSRLATRVQPAEALHYE